MNTQAELFKSLGGNWMVALVGFGRAVTIPVTEQQALRMIAIGYPVTPGTPR